MEDRWTAIRWAIGTAQRKDVVVLAGKGAQDYQEYIFDNELVKASIYIIPPQICPETIIPIHKSPVLIL